MNSTGTCSKTNTTCKSGHFCPTTGTETVDCIPCEEEMKLGQGCYCKDDTVTTNCKTCTGEACTACLPGTFLNTNVCSRCRKGCVQCTASNSCQKCADGFIIEGTKCIRVCGSSEDCGDQVSTFCDISTKRCVPCGQNCTICSSATFCNACNGSTHVTTIHGTCTLLCNNLADGNYCKDGSPKPCAEGIDSACECEFASNCASCTTELNACETCLPNVVMGVAGTCNACAVGYKFIGDMCWAEQKSGGVNRIGTGAIVGIVVGVLVVVGAVGGGLAYYFIRKAKK
ncbi:Cysteine-rich membrane protein 1 [Spironucleus salmonicida]|uniref:Cysteine-rich membrane protein 1 n=1 Tax=Spironucleus salmonicida TaxID=348837 RepID=V6LLK6_9EUKA|nr:Cysteine-rich membrane protein 1 [Spironucleus salmonicida]|eukprot:EST41579.1 Cysteine-rich membrane protein 1 [Spironucleus salmonicida]